MFRAIIFPIFRNTILCVTVCGIMHPRCCGPATSKIHYTTNCNTQYSVPEDGQNNYPKHDDLTGIINKPLLLQIVGCLYYLYQWCTFQIISDNEMCLLIKYIKSVIWSRGLKRRGRESVPCGECSCVIGSGITDLSKNLTKLKYS